jgi:acetyl-CoA C-acetyltransferase
MVKTVILDGARTPVGKFGGALSSLQASELGGTVMKEALRHSDVKPEELDEIIFGNVLQAGQGQIPSRQAAQAAGIPWNIKTETINAATSNTPSLNQDGVILYSNNYNTIYLQF